MKKKNKVVEILMHRDGDTEVEAKSRIAECKREMMESIACGDYEGAEDMLAYDLGLEMDYIFDIL